MYDNAQNLFSEQGRLWVEFFGASVKPSMTLLVKRDKLTQIKFDLRRISWTGIPSSGNLSKTYSYLFLVRYVLKPLIS